MMVAYTLNDFWDAYERLAHEGKCDSPGGGEFTRVQYEWQLWGRPDPEEFIVQRANVGPFDPRPE